MHPWRTQTLAGLGVGLLLVLAGCSSSDREQPLPEAAIQVADQTSDGKSLTVESVEIIGSNGFVVIHTDAGGEPGNIVGRAPISEGTTDSLTIPVDDGAKIETGKYWPIVHIDDGDGQLEFPGPDAPVSDSDRQLVTQLITVTVN